MSAPSIDRFETDVSRLVRLWAAIWGGALLIGAVVIRLDEGAWPSGWVAGISAGIVLIVCVMVVGLLWRHRVHWVEAGPDHLRFADRHGIQTIPWADLEDYQHYRAKTEQWRFSLCDGTKAQFVAEGFEPGDRARLTEAIYAHLVARGLAEPLPNGRHRRLA